MSRIWGIKAQGRRVEHQQWNGWIVIQQWNGKRDEDLTNSETGKEGGNRQESRYRKQCCARGRVTHQQWNGKRRDDKTRLVATLLPKDGREAYTQLYTLRYTLGRRDTTVIHPEVYPGRLVYTVIHSYTPREASIHRYTQVHTQGGPYTPLYTGYTPRETHIHRYTP